MQKFACKVLVVAMVDFALLSQKYLTWYLYRMHIDMQRERLIRRVDSAINLSEIEQNEIAEQQDALLNLQRESDYNKNTQSVVFIGIILGAIIWNLYDFYV